MTIQQPFIPRAALFTFEPHGLQPISPFGAITIPSSPFSPEARKGALVVLLEPINLQATQLESAVNLTLQTVQRSFYADESASVTSALRAAVQITNQALYRQNRSRPAERRALFGITAAVLREGVAHFAQVAPSQIFVRSRGRLRALPTPQGWGAGDARLVGPVRGLGASLSIDPALGRADFGQGDGLIFGDQRLSELLDQPGIEAALRHDNPEQAAESLGRLIIGRSQATLPCLIVLGAPALSRAAQSAPLSADGVAERSRRVAGGVQAWLADLGAEAQSIFQPRRRPLANRAEEAAGPDPLKTLPPEPGFSAEPPPRPRPIDLGAPLSERGALPPSAFFGEGEPIEPIVREPQRIDLGDPPPPSRPFFRPRLENRPLIDMTWGERFALPFQWSAAFVDERLRQRALRRRGLGASRPPRAAGFSLRDRKRPPFPWLLLMTLIITVGALIVYGNSLSQQNVADNTLDYLTIAEQRMAEVAVAATEPEALDRLDNARQAIDAVRASPSVTITNSALWLRYLDLESEYERAIAGVQRLSFFERVEVVAEHPSPIGSFSAMSGPVATLGITDPILLENLRYLYAVDTESARPNLFRIPLEGGTPQPYLSPDQQVQTTIVGALRAATWRLDQIVAIDQGPGGFGYYFRVSDQWNYTKLGDSDIWQLNQPLDIETYGGNLYVWGAIPNEILRFTTGFYGDPPQFWIDQTGLEGRDLSSVVDMAIDGNIYLLERDGGILIFNAGRLIGDLRPEAITPPITQVERFFITGSPEEGAIYLVDQLNERIIKLDKGSGEVLQQMRMRPDDEQFRLDDVRAIWVDQSGGTPLIYLANGREILRMIEPNPRLPTAEPTTTP